MSCCFADWYNGLDLYSQFLAMGYYVLSFSINFLSWNFSCIISTHYWVLLKNKKKYNISPKLHGIEQNPNGFETLASTCSSSPDSVKVPPFIISSTLHQGLSQKSLLGSELCVKVSSRCRLGQNLLLWVYFVVGPSCKSQWKEKILKI